jgi:hypothetical protein
MPEIYRTTWIRLGLLQCCLRARGLDIRKPASCGRRIADSARPPRRVPSQRGQPVPRVIVPAAPNCGHPGHNTAVPQPSAPESCFSFVPSETRARGMPGADLTRGPPIENKSKRQSPQGSAQSSGIPCAMILRRIARSPRGDRAFLPPSPHGSYPRTWPQRREARTTRPRRPRSIRSSGETTRPSHPHLRSVTIGHNALCTEARWCEEIPAFLKHRIKYFSRRDWTLESALNRLTKFDSSRTLYLWRNGGQNLAVSAHAATDSLTELHLLKQILG